MASRLQTVFNHLHRSESNIESAPTAAFLPNYQVKDDDIVIVSARRTPIGKAKRGSFKVWEMLMSVFKKNVPIWQHFITH